MAVSKKYGKIDIQGVPDNEPVFVIRAQDTLGIPVIIEYLRQRMNLGCYVDRAEFADIVKSFADYSPKKLPD